MNSQDNITKLATATAIQKIGLVISNTGAVVQKRIYKGLADYTSSYEKGKVIIKDKEGKTVKTIDVVKPAKQEDKKANKNKLKNNTTTPDVQNTHI